MISVITSTYKRPRKLKHAIESVQNQTFEDWEHIIVHDGPASFETKAVIAEYKNDKRVKFIELDKNHGSHTKPKNVGLLASKGDLICYLDDDNEFLPNFMEALKLELELSGVDIVYGLERIFKNRNDKRGSQAISLPFDGQSLLIRSYIDTGAVLHRRDAVFQVGGWDETLPRFADWNLFVRMAKAGLKFKQVPIYLTKYYISHDNSAKKHPVKSWIDPETKLTFFAPTWFNPAGCKIWGPWLGQEEPSAKVAIFSLVYDRHEYAEKTFDSLASSTKYPYEHVMVAQSEEDAEFVREYAKKNDIELEEYDGV
ncbi:MAG: glycosyltransferase [Nitrosopumilus sp.]